MEMQIRKMEIQIRKIVAVLIPIIVTALWVSFFSMIPRPSLESFLFIAILVPMEIAFFFVSILVWNKSKIETVSMLIPIIVTALWVSFFLQAELSFSRLLLAVGVISIVLASFYISILAWSERKLVAIVMLIPTIATVIWTSFFPTIIEPSPTRFLLVTTLISIIFASLYASILAWHKVSVATLLISIVTATWGYFFLTEAEKAYPVYLTGGDFSLVRQLVAALIVPLVFVSFCIPILLRGKRKEKIIVTALIPIIVAAVWSYYFLTITEFAIFKLLLIGIVVAIVLASFFASFLMWSDRKKKILAISLLISIIIGTWAYFLYPADPYYTRGLLPALLVPMIFASFSISILARRKSKPKI